MTRKIGRSRVVRIVLQYRGIKVPVCESALRADTHNVLPPAVLGGERSIGGPEAPSRCHEFPVETRTGISDRRNFYDSSNLSAILSGEIPGENRHRLDVISFDFGSKRR